MDKWKVEEQILREKTENEICNIVKETSDAEKFELIDDFYEGKLEYLVNLNKIFNNAVRNGEIKRSSNDYFDVNNASYVAWLKRNDPKDLVSKIAGKQYTGKIHCFNGIDNIRLQSFCMDSTYRSRWGTHIYSTLLDELFYRTLQCMKRKEEDWFTLHDPLEVKKRDFLNTHFVSSICPYVWSSNGFLGVTDDNGNEHAFTIEEMDEIISKAKVLQSVADSLKIDKAKFLNGGF